MSDFERVKAVAKLREIIPQETGYTLHDKTGHLSECPFCHHKDCFSIPRGGTYDGTWKCHSCDLHGDLFTFLERFHSLDKAGALKKGAELAGITLEMKKRKPLSRQDQIRIEAAEYYHGRMIENGGKEYFVDRRGHRLATLQAEKCGWSDGRLLDHLRSKGFTDAEIVESGLAKEKEIEGGTRVLDFFPKGMAIFPHWSHRRILHFTMKDPRQIPKEEKYKFQLPAKHRDKKWCFYGQDVFDHYEEFILVEGENDRLQVLDSGVSYCMAMIGQISDDQLKVLANRCKTKHLFLWTDNDDAGRKYIRMICKALPDAYVRVIVYGKEGDDPDSYLRQVEGDRKKHICQLRMDALDYIAWEIVQASLLPSLEEKLKQLTAHRVFAKINSQTEIHQDVYKEKLTALGFSDKAIDKALDTSHELKELIDIDLDGMSISLADPNVLANIIFNYFSQHGRFYHDFSDTVSLIYHDVTFEVGNNVPFNSLMHHMTGLIYTKSPAVSVWEALRNKAYRHGKRITKMRWVHTDDVKNTIYLNFNSANNVVLKISADGITEIKNGVNPENILLSTSRKIMPFNYLPDADIQEGIDALKELVMDNLCCDRKQRYFVLCWLMSVFVLDYVPSQAHMKFSGSSGGGKTTAARLMTTLLFGSEHISDPTAAAAYSMAAQNPMLVVDNLETRDVTRGMQKFLLDSATRGEKNKRMQGGSGTEITDEAPRALVAVTAIEPFTLPELINRTYDIWFDYKAFGNDGFYEREIIRGIKRKRDTILSAMLKLTQRHILPNIDTCHEFISVLRKDYKGHSKERSNEFLAMLMLILEKIINYLPYYGPDDLLYGIETGEKEIRDAWISEQNRKARDTEITSNNILKLLDGLVREYLLFLREKKLVPEWDNRYDSQVWIMNHPEYGLEMIKTKPEEIVDESTGETYSRSYVEFVAQSKDIVAVFDRFCRNNGLKNPYDSAAVFGARLKNDISMMKKGGWELVVKEGKEGPYFRSVKGVNYYKFRNTIIR